MDSPDTAELASLKGALLQQPPTILQDDQPLEAASTTTTMSIESGIHSFSSTGAMMDANPSSVFTDTLSSFSSDHSSFLGGSNNNSSNQPLSTPASRRSSMQFTKQVEVKETTLDAPAKDNEDGRRKLGEYILEKEIGRGAFGKVLLAIHEETSVGYAIKEFSKSKLRKKDKANLFKLGPRGRGRGRRGPEAPTSSSSLDLIRGEVAILKKLHHPNIVKLFEVLDVVNDDSMYMVFEWCEKGVLMQVSLTESCESSFSDEESRDVFQQMILGIEYLHEHDIIHRDIKPDNLLRSADGTVKIVDFGVSEMFDRKGDDLTKKSAGSPAFMAPELCRPDHGEVSGRATDIWSMGVTLYCLRYGRLPYISASILEMQRVIREQDVVIPEEEKDPRFRELMSRLLDKDPAQRITIEQLRNDPWVTNDGKEALISKEENTENAVTEVTDEELKGAIRKLPVFMVMKAAALFLRGKKSHGPVSVDESASAPSASTATEVSERERMQDAEEGDGTNITQIPVPAEESTQVEESSTLEGAVSQLSLGNAGLEKDQDEEQEEEKEHAVKSKNATPESASNSESVQVPVLVVPTAEAEETTEGEDESEGYQMCNMETGMCYWVPAKKVKSTPPTSETSTTTTTTTTTPALTPSSPAIKVAAVETNVPVESTTVEVPAVQQQQRAASPTPPRSSSPSQSLTPAPRLVGKLSRERFAMFEKNS